MASDPDRLADAIVAAREAWPGVALDPDRLASYLAARGAPNPGLRVTDLYLACACADGVATALQWFERELIGCVERAVRRVGGHRSVVDEVIQRLRVRLLVGDATTPPAITAYSGRGSLLGWLRIVATRETLMLRRREKFEAPLDDAGLAALPSPESDPELAYLNLHYRTAFRAAFQAAFSALEPLARDMVRGHYIDGATFDTLAERHQVHRATAARWVARAREELLTRTRDQLSRTLDVSGEDLDSILRLIGSRLEVSLRTQL